jgi:hypothetical protein
MGQLNSTYTCAPPYATPGPNSAWRSMERRQLSPTEPPMPGPPAPPARFPAAATRATAGRRRCVSGVCMMPRSTAPAPKVSPTNVTRAPIGRRRNKATALVGIYRADQWASCKAPRSPTRAGPPQQAPQHRRGARHPRVLQHGVRRGVQCQRGGERRQHHRRRRVGLLKNISLSYGVSQFSVSLIKLMVRR